MDAILIIKIVELCLIHGPTIAAKMITGLNVEHVTLEQIEGLLVKSPESYFEVDNDG